MRGLWPLLLCASACDAGFQKESIVVDLRVLAMRTDPAEVVVDFDPANPTNVALPPVTVTGLVVDPTGPRRLDYTMTACGTTDSVRCDDPAAVNRRLAEGSIANELATGVLQPDVELLQAALAADDLRGLGGIPVQIELVVAPEGGAAADAVHASKRIFLAPRIPAGRMENANPTMADLLADGTSLPSDAPLEVAVGVEVTLLPVEPPGVRETYTVPTLDGDTRTFTENMRYSWLATAGSFSDERTGGPTDFFGNVPLLRTRWRAPKDPATVTLWVVQRDERGGTYWTEHTILVHN